MRHFAFIALLLTQPLFGNDLCRYLLAHQGDMEDALAAYSTEKLNTAIGQMLAHEDLNAVNSIIQPYVPLLVHTESPTQTVHSFQFSRGDEVVVLGGSPTDDAVQILELPKPGEGVWETLSPQAREDLVRHLLRSFRSGVYERYETEYLESIQEALIYKSYRLALEGKEDVSIGFSPVHVYESGFRHGLVGVCRHSNCALAGLMGELGIPNEDLRLVTGKDSEDAKVGHIWVEYRSSREGRWIEADATARVSTATRRSSPMDILGMLTAPAQKASQIYVFNRTEIYNFLKPASNRIPHR